MSDRPNPTCCGPAIVEWVRASDSDGEFSTDSWAINIGGAYEPCWREVYFCPYCGAKLGLLEANNG